MLNPHPLELRLGILLTDCIGGDRVKEQRLNMMVANLPALTVLDLSNSLLNPEDNKLTNVGIQHLQRLQGLVELNLGSFGFEIGLNKIGDTEADVIASLPLLQRLYIRNLVQTVDKTKIGWNGLSVICRNPNLTHLSVGGNSYNDEKALLILRR